MSGLINKVKDALHSDKDKHNDPRSDNYGHHSTNTGNVVDPRVDSDVSGGRGGNYGAPGGGYGDNTTGGYGAGTTTSYGGSNTAGPHSSNLANKADPRVDSNLDGSRTVGGSGYGSGNTAGGYGSGNTGAYDSTTTGGGYGSTTAGTGYGSSNTAPHNSNLANKLDPRVDSDRDGRNPTSTYGSSTSGGAYTGTTSGGSANVGPHSSNLANKLDPRVDSDRDNRNDPSSRVGGYGTQDNYGVSGANPTPSGGNAGYGNTGYGGTTGTTTGGYGESGYGSGNTHHGTHHGNTGLGGDQYGSSATPGSGNAASTAGPHNSNLLNKLDPRVDSDADGSKTYGGNQTYR